MIEINATQCVEMLVYFHESNSIKTLCDLLGKRITIRPVSPVTGSEWKTAFLVKWNEILECDQLRPCIHVRKKLTFQGGTHTHTEKLKSPSFSWTILYLPFNIIKYSALKCLFMLTTSHA